MDQNTDLEGLAQEIYKTVEKLHKGTKGAELKESKGGGKFYGQPERAIQNAESRALNSGSNNKGELSGAEREQMRNEAFYSGAYKKSGGNNLRTKDKVASEEDFLSIKGRPARREEVYKNEEAFFEKYGRYPTDNDLYVER